MWLIEWNQPKIFIGRIDPEAESSSTLATWYNDLTHCKRTWCWKRWKAKGEGRSRRWDGLWHHGLNRHEFEQSLRESGEQRNLEWCSPWGHKKSGAAQQLSDKCSCSVTESCWAFCDHTGLYPQAFLSIRFFRKEYWRGLPFFPTHS